MKGAIPEHVLCRKPGSSSVNSGLPLVSASSSCLESLPLLPLMMDYILSSKIPPPPPPPTNYTKAKGDYSAQFFSDNQF